MTAQLLWLLVVACVLVALLAWRWETRLRRGLGLEGVDLVASDDSRIPTDTLMCAPLGLVGRPDHLALAGHARVPVEVKPGATVLRESHVLQLAAQCVLVHHVHGTRPPGGIAVLAGGRREVVPFTQDLERLVLDSLAEMRMCLRARRAPRDTGSPTKCGGCSYGRSCPVSRAGGGA